MTFDDIKTTGIVGAGQMGRGISQVCATAGYRVLLVDVAEPPLTEALSKIQAGLERAVERGSLTDHQAGEVLALIRPMVQLERLREVQLVIEAIPEDLALKQELFAELNRVCRPHTVLASNTASISITKLGAASGRPDRVVGLHFMNPAPVMRLIEVVHGLETSERTLNLALELAKRLGKTPVVAKDVPGFIVNRVLIPMINEAIFALEEGVAIAEDIDLAMTTGANHPVGPLGSTIANLGWDELRFPMPVYPGDTLRTETVVHEMRESRSRPDAGIVVFVHRCYNQRNEEVALCKRTALIKRKAVR